MRTKKTEYIRFRLEPLSKSSLAQIADCEKRALSEILRSAVEEFIEKRTMLRAAGRQIDQSMPIARHG